MTTLLLFSMLPAAALAQNIEVLPTPDRIHWVQVAAFDTAVSAEAFAGDVRGRGHTPVCVIPSGGQHTVRVGEFMTMMDALLVMEDVRDLFPDVRVRFNSLQEEREAGREWSFQPLTAPPSSREIFALTERPFPEDVSLRFVNEDCALLDGSMRVAARVPHDQEMVLITAENLIEFAEDSQDTATAEGSIMLADVLARTGDYQGARGMALPVADGTLTATPQMRYDAMWLMARVYHAMDWRRTAYRAYTEIESVATDERDLVRSRLERAALLLELAESGTGRMADCRLACERLIAEWSDSPDPEVHLLVATTAQVRAETFLMDGDPERAQEELELVAASYSDVDRVLGMSLYFQTHVLSDLDREEEAMQVMERLAHLHLSNDANFPNFNVSEMSLNNLVVLALRNDDLERAEQFFLEFARWASPGSPRLRSCAQRMNRIRELLSPEAGRLVDECLGAQE